MEGATELPCSFNARLEVSETTNQGGAATEVDIRRKRQARRLKKLIMTTTSGSPAK